MSTVFRSPWLPDPPNLFGVPDFLNPMDSVSRVTAGRQPFTPAALANVRVWLDSTRNTFQETTGSGATTPAVADNDPVGTIRDLVGGLYPVAPSSGKRPLIQTVNGLRVLQFDGVDDLLSCVFTQVGTAGQFIAVRVKLTAAGSFPMIYVARETARELRGTGSTGVPVSLTNGGASGVTGGSSIVGAWSTVIANHDYALDTADLYVNGTLVATVADTTNPATAAATTAAVGDRPGTPGNPFQGLVRHVVYGERKLTDAEVTQLNTFLSTGP